MLRIYVYVEKSRNVGEIVDQKPYFKLHWGGRSDCAKLSQNNLVHTTASRSFFDWNLSRDFMSIKPFRWDHRGQSKKCGFSKGYDMQRWKYWETKRKHHVLSWRKKIYCLYKKSSCNLPWELSMAPLNHDSFYVNLFFTFARWIYFNGWTDYLPLFLKISECWSSIEKKIKD